MVTFSGRRENWLELAEACNTAGNLRQRGTYDNVLRLIASTWKRHKATADYRERKAAGQEPKPEVRLIPNDDGTIDLELHIDDEPRVVPEVTDEVPPPSEFAVDGGSGRTEISSERLEPTKMLPEQKPLVQSELLTSKDPEEVLAQETIKKRERYRQQRIDSNE